MIVSSGNTAAAASGGHNTRGRDPMKESKRQAVLSGDTVSPKNLGEAIEFARLRCRKAIVSLPWHRRQCHLSGLVGPEPAGVFDAPEWVALTHLSGWRVTVREVRTVGQSPAEEFINSGSGAYESREATEIIPVSAYMAEMKSAIGGNWYEFPDCNGYPMQMSGDHVPASPADKGGYNFVGNLLSGLYALDSNPLPALRKKYPGRWEVISREEFLGEAPTPKGSLSWLALARNDAIRVRWTPEG